MAGPIRGLALLLEANPDAFVPVAAAFVVAPSVLILVGASPFPIVVVDVETPLRAVVILLLCPPAVAFAIADDGGTQCQLRRGCRQPLKPR